MRYMDVAEQLCARLSAQKGFRGNHIPMKVTPGGILAPYKGLNVLLLNLFSQDGAMRSSVWGTFKSLLKTLGHPVQKGQKASGTIVWVGKGLVSKKESEETPKDEDEDEKYRPDYKTWSVFNFDQVENVPRQQDRPKNLLMTHEDAHKVFLEVIKEKQTGPRPPDDVMATRAIQVAHAFLDMASGKEVVVDNPGLWSSTKDMLSIVGNAQDLFNGLSLDPNEFWAFGVPELPEIPANAPDLPGEAPAAQEPVAAAPSPDPVASAPSETDTPVKPKRKSKPASKEDVLAFLDW